MCDRPKLVVQMYYAHMQYKYHTIIYMHIRVHCVRINKNVFFMDETGLKKNDTNNFEVFQNYLVD